MPLFKYEALTDKGKKFSGKVDADSIQSAKIKLLKLKIAAISLSPVEEKELKTSFHKREVLTFTREVSRLLSAGLPLYEAISALEEKYKNQKLHFFLLDTLDQLRGGSSFSKALQRYSKSFDLLYISMIQNSEKTGNLAEALKELGELISKQIQLKKQIISTLLYPTLLASFCMVVLGSLFFFVIPSLKELFEGRNLHPFTSIVFSMSEFFVRSKNFMLLFFFFCLSFAVLTSLIGSWKKKRNQMFLRLPFFNALFFKVSLVRFSRALSTLLEGGVSLLPAISQGKSMIFHPLLEKVILEAEEKVKQGESLSSIFAKEALIPPLIPRMLAIGEEGGSLSQTFLQISEIYEEELESTMKHFSTMAQPILLIFLGALVGFVLLSVLLPLTDVSSFVN